MNVGVPKEVAPGERRVAVTPDVAARLVKSKNSVAIQAGAGEAAGFLDAAYTDAGAAIVPTAAAVYDAADCVLKVARPQDDEIAMLRSGCVLVAFLAPLNAPQTAAQLAARGVTALAMELIPRISRAQSMDALSSQATVSGYKAALYAAESLPKFFPMLMTAAGTIAPSKVLVLGAGVAGLQAIATARRLGAVVTGYDTRPVVKEQVESLGASFVAPPVTGEGTGGYARELTSDEQRQNRDALARFVADNDVVVTTALVPGRRAPILISDDMLAGMRPGSVVVDLAAEAGGNTEGAQPGSTVVKHGVSIVAPLNVPSSMPFHASQLYARNLWALFDHLVKDGTLTLDMNDEITKGVCVTRDGAVVNATVAALVKGGAA